MAVAVAGGGNRVRLAVEEVRDLLLATLPVSGVDGVVEAGVEYELPLAVPGVGVGVGIATDARTAESCANCAEVKLMLGVLSRTGMRE